MTFFERLELSWEFLVDCVKFLKNNPDLFILPLLSLIMLGGLIASMVYVSVLDLNWLFNVYQQNGLLLIGGLIAIYFALSFMMLYFNAALVECVLQRLQGNNISVGQGLVLASKKAGLLFQWSLVSATVCLIINALERLHSAIADVMSAIFGFSWGVTSYFVLPVMIAEGIGPFEAFKRSIQLIGKGWRKLLSVNLVFFAILVAVIAVGYFILYFFPQLIEAFPVNFPVLAFMVVAWFMVSKTFSTIFNCALYLTIKQQDLAKFNTRSIKQLIQQHK